MRVIESHLLHAHIMLFGLQKVAAEVDDEAQNSTIRGLATVQSMLHG
jgi:hypothetical protein